MSISTMVDAGATAPQAPTDTVRLIKILVPGCDLHFRFAQCPQDVIHDGAVFLAADIVEEAGHVTFRSGPPAVLVQFAAAVAAMTQGRPLLFAVPTPRTACRFLEPEANPRPLLRLKPIDEVLREAEAEGWISRVIDASLEGADTEGADDGA